MRVFSVARWGCVLLATAVLCAAIQAAAQEKSAAADRQYNAAVGLHNSEAYDLAAQEWQKFVQDYSGDSRVARALHYLGICYSKKKDLQKAVETFETIVKDHADFELLAETYLNLGLTQYNLAHSGKAEMYDAAAETFDALATKYPQGKHAAEAIFYQGECLYNRGKKEQAAEKYAQVLQRHSDHQIAAQATFALGVAQADLGQHKAAIKSYDAYLSKHADQPQATEVTMWRGESLYALKQYAEAAAAFAAAAGEEGFSLADYVTVRQADAIAAQKQYARAAALYASVPEKFNNSQYAASCGLAAGKNYYAAGDFARASGYLEKIAAAGGQSAPEAAHWAARCLLKQDRPDQALKLVEQVLPKADGGPFQCRLLMDRADAVYEIPARRGESVELYAELAAKHPGDASAPQALYMACFAAMNLADYKTAVTHAEAFLAAHTDHELAVGVMHVLAESKLLTGGYADAEKLYDRLLKKAPDDRDAEIWKVHRGTAIYLQKRYQQTVAALEPVMAEIGKAELAAEGWYRIGRSQAALKQFDAAVTSLQASVKAKAQWKLADDARLVLAFAYQQTGKLDQARRTAQEVLAEFPNSRLLDMAHYRLGECCRLDGDFNAAVKQYQQIIDQWPKTTLMRQTLYGLGWAKLGLEDHAGAEQAFSKLIQQHPEDKLVPRARYGRGTVRRQLKKYAPAVEDLEAFLAGDPAADERSRARHVLGLCQSDLKQSDKAVATFQGLLAEDPGYAEKANVYFDLGWAQKSSGREAEAAATFAKLTAEFPDHALAADGHYLVADHAFAQKDYEKAATDYFAAMQKAAKQKQPQLAEEAAHKLGWTYYLQDELEKAQKMFLYQRATWPQGPLAADAAFREGECLFKQEKFREAAAAYENVDKPTSKQIELVTLLHWADAAGQLKQWGKSLKLAVECAQESADSPHHAQALYQQGWALQNLEKPDEALAIYARVIAESEKEPAARAQLMIGMIQFGREQHAEAIRSYYKVIYGYGYADLQADATYESARCFEVLKQVPQALKLYRMLVEKYPKSEHVSWAKQRIEELK